MVRFFSLSITLSVLVAFTQDTVYADKFSRIHRRDDAASFSPTQQMPSGTITDPTPVNNATFDYIIVGCGNAGMVLANRLSEDPSKTVLCIEEGGDIRYDPDVFVANETYAVNRDNPDHAWRYPAVPQIENTKPEVWFGKGIGGSTNVNGQVWNAPSKAQIDAMGQLGNEGWSFDELLPYFLRAQDYHPPSAELAKNPGVTYDPKVHRSGGPVTLSHPNITFVPQTQSVFIKAVKTALGIDRAKDLQSGSNIGVAFVAQTISPNSTLQRVSSATAYFTPIEGKRPNLLFMLKSRVTRIILEDSSNDSNNKNATANVRATGVEFQLQKGGQVFTANSEVEVILSAGSLRSPWLLELSGIGQQRQLSAIGIAQKVELPGVGMNHIEQYQVGSKAPVANLSWHGFGASSSIAQASAKQLFGKNVSDVEKYVRSMHDQWAQDQVNAGAAYNVEGIKKQYELMSNGIFSNEVPISENFFGNGFWGPLSALSMSLYVLTPYSRGYVHAISSDPWSDPVFNPRFFTVPFDMDIEVANLRAARDIFNTTEMHAIMNGTTIEPTFNGTMNTADEYQFLRSWVIQKYSTLDHSVGTCSMMPEKYGGVVDPQFKVYGTSNLRVVDASIFPMQLSAHTQATVYAIAEKASDVIKMSTKSDY